MWHDLWKVIYKGKNDASSTLKGEQLDLTSQKLDVSKNE